MALIYCPECGKQISDSAASCPNCGYVPTEADKNFVPVIKKLTEPKIKRFRKIPLVIISLYWLAALVVALVIKKYMIVHFFISIVLGLVILFLTAQKYQQGECPYCGELLNFNVGSSSSFKCPSCNNVGKRTDNTLESTH